MREKEDVYGWVMYFLTFCSQRHAVLVGLWRPEREEGQGLQSSGTQRGVDTSAPAQQCAHWDSVKHTRMAL